MSWGAIIAGAVVAAAVSLILLVLGSGLGLAVVSPWSNSGVYSRDARHVDADLARHRSMGGFCRRWLSHRPAPYALDWRSYR